MRWRTVRKREGEGGVLICHLPFRHLTVDLASLSRRRTVPTLERGKGEGVFRPLLMVVTCASCWGTQDNINGSVYKWYGISLLVNARYRSPREWKGRVDGREKVQMWMCLTRHRLRNSYFRPGSSSYSDSYVGLGVSYAISNTRKKVFTCFV